MNDVTQIRSEEELHYAHDVLVGVILGHAPFPDVGLTMRDLNLMAQVVCWVMHHEHNMQFPLTLERIVADLRAQGFVLVDRGASMGPAEPGQGVSADADGLPP